MPEATVVQTRDGKVKGFLREADDGRPVAVHLGIPYATAERFAPPVPAAPWTDLRPALEFGPICPQPGTAAFERADQPRHEDCLSVNVWSPAGSAPESGRPVLLWIHGGAFRQGSGTSPLYDGTQLAARGDVVVISCNYRLGALGFLGHPSLGPSDGPHANWGLLDQVEALRWVQDNAAAFGGDPDNVTIFGESAGAVSVLLLSTMPAARGLFGKAIVQSGGAMALPFEAASRRAEQLAEAAGVASVADLATVPVEDLLAAQTSLEGLGLGMRGFVPTVDERTLPLPALEALRAGAAHDIPMLIGTNVDEWKLWAPMDPRSRDLDADRLRGRLAKRVPAAAVEGLITAVEQARAERNEPVDPKDLFFAIESERFFRVPSVEAADAQRDHGPTFVYLFEWTSPAMGGWLGACHGLEIAFAFGNQGRGEIAAFTGSGADADAVAERMMDAWIAFARTGDPSTSELAWPVHDKTTRPTMVFDATTRVEQGPRDRDRVAVAAAMAG